ncbi:hypothetical protein [Streptomyces sp. NPDC048442]|uniref:hypothetical protein n=1 Tax=Streptomyces sp. NPDC048442 TaxID=3154823 RepID=UPI00343FBAC4
MNGEFEHQKELYRDLNHSVTLIKYELAGLALGFTLIKADFTFLKADEKGITLRGRQLVTFPWADQKKALEERIKRVNEKVADKQDSLAKKVARLETMRDRVDQVRDDARTAVQSGAGGNAQRAAAKREISGSLVEISKEVRKGAQIEKKVDQQIARIEKQAKKYDRLDGRLETIKQKEDALKKAGKEARANATTARTAVQELRTNLRSTQRDVRSLSRSLDS